MTATTRGVAGSQARTVQRTDVGSTAQQPKRRSRTKPSGFVQWQALTGRALWTMLTKGELLVAVIAPLIFTVGFYLPLKFVMGLQGIDYAQFLMPIIVLQAMAFTAISAAQRARPRR